MNIKQEIKELREKLEQLEKECADKKASKWPQDDNVYHSIDSTGHIFTETWYGTEFDCKRKSIGNIFKTKQEALAEVEAHKVVAELRATEGRFDLYSDNIAGVGLNVCSTQVKTTTNVFDFFLAWESEGYAQQAIDQVGKARIIAAAKHLGRVS